jgi:[ribosomal protein S5]-alanine N-acetyltransferase
MTDRVLIRAPRPQDEEEFLRAVRRSRVLHRGWVSPPATSKRYREYLDRERSETHLVFLVWVKRPRCLAGVVNVSEIVRGSFQSAYLGYYVFLPYAGRGLMREGIAKVIRHVFHRMRLHRLEANIQPDNRPSKALVRSLGFRREGFSPRYLKIAGRWRDHERWALLAEDWVGLTHDREPARRATLRAAGTPGEGAPARLRPGIRTPARP